MSQGGLAFGHVLSRAAWVQEGSSAWLRRLLSAPAPCTDPSLTPCAKAVGEHLIPCHLRCSTPGLSRAASSRRGPSSAQPRPNPSWQQPGGLSPCSSPAQPRPSEAHPAAATAALLEMSSVPLGQAVNLRQAELLWCFSSRVGLMRGEEWAQEEKEGEQRGFQQRVPGGFGEPGEWGWSSCKRNRI